MSLAREIFGDESVLFIDTIRTLIPKLTGSSPDFFESASEYYWKKSEADGLFCYWTELFGRAYIAAAAGLIRHNQWIVGIESCYHTHSYLGLCGCLRGLIESTADAMYTLECFLPTVTPIWSELDSVFSGRPVSRPIIAKELEDNLIHFVFARHVKKGELVPDGHRALQNRDYIDTIRKADPSLEAMYCSLVEIVHPAKDSVHWMLQYEQKDTHWKVSLNAGDEAGTAICKILDSNKSALFHLVMLSCNYSLITLKGIRAMNIKGLDLSFMDQVDLSNIPAWNDFEKHIKC